MRLGMYQEEKAVKERGTKPARLEVVLRYMYDVAIRYEQVHFLQRLYATKLRVVDETCSQNYKNITAVNS